MTTFIVVTGIALVALVVYLWFAWWLSMVMQRARREQTRELRDREL